MSSLVAMGEKVCIWLEIKTADMLTQKTEMLNVDSLLKITPASLYTMKLC